VPDSAASFCFRISDDDLAFNFVDLFPATDTVELSVDSMINLEPSSINGGDEVQQLLLRIMESVGSIDGVKKPSLNVSSVVELVDNTDAEINGLVAVESVVVDRSSAVTTAALSPTVNASSQTDRARQRSLGAQTPRPNTLYLPMEISLGQMVSLLHANPELTVEGITRAVSRQRPSPIPDEQLLIMDLVLHGMQLAEQRLVELVILQQQEMERLGLESDVARERFAAFHHYISSLVHRPYSDPQTPQLIDLSHIPEEIDLINGYRRLLRGEVVPGLLRQPRTFLPAAEAFSDLMTGTFDVGDAASGQAVNGDGGNDDIVDVSD